MGSVAMALPPVSDPTRLQHYAGMGLTETPVQKTQHYSTIHPDAAPFVSLDKSVIAKAFHNTAPGSAGTSGASGSMTSPLAASNIATASANDSPPQAGIPTSAMMNTGAAANLQTGSPPSPNDPSVPGVVATDPGAGVAIGVGGSGQAALSKTIGSTADSTMGVMGPSNSGPETFTGQSQTEPTVASSSSTTVGGNGVKAVGDDTGATSSGGINENGQNINVVSGSPLKVPDSAPSF